MQEDKSGKVQFISLEHLAEKKRNSREELLFQSIRKLEPVYWSGVRMAEDCLYGAFSFHEGQNPDGRASIAAFLLGKEGFILAVLEDEGGIFPRKELSGMENHDAGGTAMEDTLEKLFERLLERGQQKTEKMEQYLIEMEHEIVSGRISRNRNQNIFECKRTLTVWKNDYGRFLNVVEGINGLEQKKNEGKGQVLTEESACFFRVYENKLKRLTEETQFLYEELVHIREALDAALSYEQNRIMKVFTTVTTIFMPLSLIAGWYGMNFTGMPELGWKYGYAFAGGLSILVILACIWFFKKKKLF
ncbi:CorA family divalent cation transporter [Petralouisia muris]|uniref:CorA family divalent cation transporter n=1 Tax=Petralouisia muris TaxID=3032872 RepID=UPI0014416860|nr:CorA family divalent cation transporter [Petralouisia muris]